ncbi:MAG TPA: prepilin-type N-terminal cleavage/methylation domain-containing protein, partial [Roseateles sp.]
MRYRPRTAHAPGFTLVELMVTVAVLVVLVAIAVPSFDGIRLSMRLSS